MWKRVSLRSIIGRSFGRMLFSRIFVVVTAMVVAFGFGTYQISKRTVIEKVEESTLQSVVQTDRRLDVLFESYIDMSVQYQLDDEVQSIFRELPEATGDYERLVLNRGLNSKLVEITVNRNVLLEQYDPAAVSDEPWFSVVKNK